MNVGGVMRAPGINEDQPPPELGQHIVVDNERRHDTARVVHDVDEVNPAECRAELILHATLLIQVLRLHGVRLASNFGRAARDRKSTRLNSSHPSISYAVFCLK